ncbi:Histidine kinase [Pseudomonas syringae pv. cilantro]|uniref:Histidine kinase n=1 Tax=Pseudomonas syringae pv. cilantro TaxID=81035 RepID=A0A0N0GI77_PSESX|nr:Histidine kinase [Pseudomonas syringae pv. cilantro]
MKTVAQLLKLKDLHNQQVHTIGPDQMVLEALRLMAEKNIGALPVVNDGVVVGVVSERDYARKVVLEGRSSVGTPVSEIMSSKVITVDSQQTVETCMGIMTDSHLRHLPVVENGQLLGLLSIGDLVKEAIAEQASLILGSIDSDFSIFFSPSLPTRMTRVFTPAPSFSSRIKAMVDCGSSALPSRSPMVLTTVYSTMLRCTNASRLAGSSSAFLRLTSVGSSVLGAMMIKGRDLPRSCAKGPSLSAASAVPAATSRVARVRDRINMVGSFQIHWVAIAQTHAMPVSSTAYGSSRYSPA